MARYRVKDETDLRWNKIRRELTRAYDTKLQHTRDYQLNKLLGHAWDEFAKALESGEKLEIEADYKDWVTQALRRVELPIEVPADEAG